MASSASVETIHKQGYFPMCPVDSTVSQVKTFRSKLRITKTYSTNHSYLLNINQCCCIPTLADVDINILVVHIVSLVGFGGQITSSGGFCVNIPALFAHFTLKHISGM